METIRATNEELDAIAEIEAQRQAMALQTGTAGAASGALRRLPRTMRSGAPGSNRRPEPRQVSLRSATRIPPRNKGRRTMGRAGGR